MDRERYDDILSSVRQPGQYVGGEWNAVVKDRGDVDFSVLLAFPDTYAIGMSHSGLTILYNVLNRMPRVAAERTFMPQVDMQEQLRSHDVPLLSLETRTPMAEFDLIGFSLQYEMGCTNVLAMLALGGVPVRSEARGDSAPLVVAGGVGAMSPEPLAPFVDLFVIGDGEEVVKTLVEAARDTRGMRREERLIAMAKASPHFYLPALYAEQRDAEGRLTGLLPRVDGIPTVIHRAVVENFEDAAWPMTPIVPFCEVIHDRITLEIMRGCTQGCRFCQAGMTRRPVRHRSIDKLRHIAEETYRATGHNEISLASLSTSDYPDVRKLIEAIAGDFGSRHVNIALPSLRVDDQLSDLPEAIKGVRRAGLTIAPEAAREEMRARINKNISTDDLLRGVAQAYKSGWRAIKLYFMIGLPGETDEDVDAIVDLAYKVSAQKGGRGGEVNVAVSSFVPKPHTPFQWEPMAEPDALRAKRRRMLERLKGRKVRLKFHKVERSQIEGVIARGDRKVADAVERAVALGARLDAWDEHFDYNQWLQAFDETGVSPADYAHRTWPEDAWLPWDHIDAGVSREFLLGEKHKSERGTRTPDCRVGPCTRCGACPGRE